MEKKLNEAEQAFFASSKQIEQQKDQLIDYLSKRLEQKAELRNLLTVKWENYFEEFMTNRTIKPEAPESLELQSFNFLEYRKSELLNLFPDAKTEGGKVDFEKLKILLSEVITAEGKDLD